MFNKLQQVAFQKQRMPLTLGHRMFQILQTVAICIQNTTNTFEFGAYITHVQTFKNVAFRI